MRSGFYWATAGYHAAFFLRHSQRMVSTANPLRGSLHVASPGALGIAEPSSPFDRSLLHLVLPAPRLPERAASARASGLVSGLLHAAVIMFVMLIAARFGSVPTSSAASSSHERLQLPRMVFLQTPGVAAGGGGGGSHQTSPPSRAQAIGRDRLTMSVVKPVIASERPADLMTPQQPMIEARPLESGATLVRGLPDAPSSLSFSQGIGFGEGVGEGTGTGIGSGTGPGVGLGSGGGFGGGAYRLGAGVVPPTLIRDVKPTYTPEALRHRIQGTVALEVVVGRNGIPLAIRVTRSLDPGGLDEEAIAAVRGWRFNPGRVGDTPVDVLVTIFMDFRVN